MIRKKRFIYFIIIQFLAIGIDQFTKFLALQNLLYKDYPLIKNILEFVYSENRGAAFGILQGAIWLFYIIVFVVAYIIIRYIYIMSDKKRMLPLFFSLCFTFAGALGNIIDRIFRGYVIDFIYFKPINFPIFNVADIYVSLSVAFLAYLLLFFYKEDEIDKFSKNIFWK